MKIRIFTNLNTKLVFALFIIQFIFSFKLVAQSTPVITQITDTTIIAGSPFAIFVEAADADLPNDSLYFTISGSLPSGMQFETDKGILSWVPNENDMGNYSFTISVSDTAAGGGTDQSSFNVTVNSVVGSGVVIYVDKDAAGANDGTSWTDAYVDLQIAMNDANDGNQIWAAA